MGRGDRGGLVITAITKEQAATGRALRDEWIARALSTTPINRPEVEKGLKLIYKSAGLSTPELIMWHPSPIKGIAAAARLIAGKHPTLTKKLVNDVFNNATNILSGGTRDEDSTLDPMVHNVLNRELVAPTENKSHGFARAIAAELSIRASVIEDTYPKLGKILQKLVERAVVSSFDAGRLALTEYASETLGVAYSSKMRTHLRGLALAARADWYWPFDNIVVVVDRPARISVDDDGQPHDAKRFAIEYSDGFGVYCRHGVRIPHEAIVEGDNPVRWTDINVTADQNVQNALAEIKAEKWSESKAKTEGESEENYEAAMAVRRLGGLSSMQDLIEEEK